MDRKLRQAGAELHLPDACVDIAVPCGIALVVKAVEVEALEDECRF